MALSKINSQQRYKKTRVIPPNSLPALASDVNPIIDVVNGATAFPGDLAVTGALTVTGASTFNGAITLGDAAADSLTVNAVTTYGEPVNYSNATGIVALGGGGQPTLAANILTEEVNNVMTVDAAGDSVLLPAAAAGKHVHVKNSGANALDIFPALADSIDALAVNLAIRIFPGASVDFYAKDAIVWESNVDVSFAVLAPTTNSGSLQLLAANSAGNFITSITNASQAAARTYTIPDAGASASFLMTAGAQTITGAQSITKAAASVSLTIDAGTTDSTADVIDINLDVNSASVNAIDISTDIGTLLSAGEIVNSIKIDSNAAVANADTSEIRGVDVVLSSIAGSRADLIGINVAVDGVMDGADTIYGVQVLLDSDPTAAVEQAGLYVNQNGTLNNASTTLFGVLVDGRDIVNTSSSEIASFKTLLEDDGKGLSIDAATVDHAAGNLIDVDADAKDIASGALKGANINIDETVAGTNGTFIYGTDIAITGFATGRADLRGQRIVFDGTKNGGDTTKGLEINADSLTLNHASETFAGLEVDASGLTNTASTSVEGIVVTMPAVGGGTAAVGLNVTMNASTEMALSTNAEVRCVEISSATSLITSMSTPPVGTGFDGALVAKWMPHGTFGVGGAKLTEFIFDLTNLIVSTTVDDIIGDSAGVANCHFGQITTAVHGTIFAMEITCLETPAGADADIDFYSAVEATGAENALITGLTETLLLARGAAWAINDYRSVVTALPLANLYLYITNGVGGGAGTYTAGKFKIRFYGE